MKRSIWISVIVSIQLVAQFAIQLLVVREVGVGPYTDAYVAAQAVPAVIVAIVTAALQSAWMPRFAVLSGGDRQWVNEQSKAQGQAALLGGGGLLFVGMTMPIWLPQLYPGFDSEFLLLTAKFGLVFLLIALLTIQSALLTVALYARNQFLIAESLPLVGTIVSLGIIWLTLPVWGLSAVVWMLLARAVVVYIAQMRLARWPLPSLSAGWTCKDTWSLMRPLLLGASVYKTSPLVDRYWASKSPAGGITLLNLAQTAMGALATVLERAICTPIIPSLAKCVSNNDYLGLRRSYRRGLRNVTVVAAGLGLLLLVTKPAFLKVAVALLDLDIEIARDFWLICVLLLGYLYGGASGTLAVAAFYAMGDSKTPVKIGVVGFVVGLGFKSIGYILYALPGLVLGTSIYYLLNMFCICLILEKVINERHSRQRLP